MWNKIRAPVIQYIGCIPDNSVRAILIERVDKVTYLFNVYLPCLENSDSNVADVIVCLSFIEWGFLVNRKKGMVVWSCVLLEILILIVLEFLIVLMLGFSKISCQNVRD